MKANYFSPKRQLEVLAEIQHKILKSGYSLEGHLETIKELSRESRLRHYERLFKEKWIDEDRYKSIIQEDVYFSLSLFSEN